MKWDLALALLIVVVWVSMGVAAYFTRGQFSSTVFMMMTFGGIYLLYNLLKKWGLIY